jgi:hypothetical protein
MICFKVQSPENSVTTGKHEESQEKIKILFLLMFSRKKILSPVAVSGQGMDFEI